MIYCQHCTRPTARATGPCPHCGKSLSPPKPTRSIAASQADETWPAGSPYGVDSAQGGAGQSRPEKQRLGEILVEAGYISIQQLNIALEIQKIRQVRLGSILLQEKFVSEICLIQGLSHQFCIPWVILERVSISEDVVKVVPVEIAEQFLLFPVYIHVTETGERWLYLAMNDPMNDPCLREMSALTGMTMKPMVASPADISKAILRYYHGVQPASAEDASTQEGAKKVPPSMEEKSLPSSSPPFPVASDEELLPDGRETGEQEAVVPERTVRFFNRPSSHDLEKNRGHVLEEKKPPATVEDVSQRGDVTEEETSDFGQTPTIIPSPDKHWEYEEIAVPSDSPLSSSTDPLSVWNIALAHESTGIGLPLSSPRGEHPSHDARAPASETASPAASPSPVGVPSGSALSSQSLPDSSDVLFGELRRNLALETSPSGEISANWQAHIVAILELLFAKGVTDLEEFLQFLTGDGEKKQ